MKQMVERFGQPTSQAAGVQIFDGADVGKRLMSARFGQQRHVIAMALVAGGLAKVENFARGVVGIQRVRQISSCRHDLCARRAKRPVTYVADDDQDIHGSACRGLCRGWRISRFASCVTMPRWMAPITRSMPIQYSCDWP